MPLRQKTKGYLPVEKCVYDGNNGVLRRALAMAIINNPCVLDLLLGICIEERWARATGRKMRPSRPCTADKTVVKAILP